VVLPWQHELLANWRTAIAEDRDMPIATRLSFFREIAERANLADGSGKSLDDIRFGSLLNCILSLISGFPVGSNETNLIQVVNSCLRSPERHRFGRIITVFIEKTKNSEILNRRSIKKSIAVTNDVTQDGRKSEAGKAIVALFPEFFDRND